MKAITIFLDDRNIFKETLIKYNYEEKLNKANIKFIYLNDFNFFKDFSIENFDVIFIFLDTCWNKRGDESALFNQIELIKGCATNNCNKKFLVFPYSTTFRDDIEFMKLYKHFNGKPNNIILDEQPFLIRKNSDYQMNGILSMIIAKKGEIEKNAK